MWVLIDNYDSFTHILLHYLLLTGHPCKVFRNDEISIAALDALKPEGIIISPGPETPLKAGITMDVIAHFHRSTPILGVCLGHQALGMYFGRQLLYAPKPMHGKVSSVIHTGHALFDGVPDPFDAMRYHSLILDNQAKMCLRTIAETEDGICMAVAHDTLPCYGVQFHPESVGTTHGQAIINNWASLAEGWK